ncbi:hypothetical protein PInf_014378 [Phytophthora infestans]|nr:hypothetical protein PInf_014378 [Phytophthora infestans]
MVLDASMHKMERATLAKLGKLEFPDKRTERTAKTGFKTGLSKNANDAYGAGGFKGDGGFGGNATGQHAKKELSPLTTG